MKWHPSEWQLVGSDPTFPTTIHRLRQREGPDKYAVRNGRGFSLNKSGEWEWEPMPSSRDTAYIQQCRFDTLGEAKKAVQEAQCQK